MVSCETAENALRTVIHPATGKDILSSGIVSGLAVENGAVRFVLAADSLQESAAHALRAQCEAAVKTLRGVTSVTAVLTAEHSSAPSAKRPAAQWNESPIPHVRRIIAVASGKGGVGKSTVAVHLAFALHRLGQRVGLLDADIYGPSLPRMLDLCGKPEIVDGQMIPLEKGGVKAMSVGFLIGDEAAILRGPMISKTLQQMLRLTRWGSEATPLDTLIVDMPPGTGDIHLSMAQQVPLSGALIVTTPQEIALEDARRAAKMFAKVGVPVLGIIENMSYFTDPSGQVHHLFGQGGGEKLARETGAPLLGAIPMDVRLREAGDQGMPENAGEGSRAVFQEIAQKL